MHLIKILSTSNNVPTVTCDHVRQRFTIESAILSFIIVGMWGVDPWPSQYNAQISISRIKRVQKPKKPNAYALQK